MSGDGLDIANMIAEEVGGPAAGTADHPLAAQLNTLRLRLDAAETAFDVLGLDASAETDALRSALEAARSGRAASLRLYDMRSRTVGRRVIDTSRALLRVQYAMLAPAVPTVRVRTYTRRASSHRRQARRERPLRVLSLPRPPTGMEPT